MNTISEVKAVGLEVLRGHYDPETALVVADYPYGRKTRTAIRYWIEQCQKGAKVGEYRFVSQTKNPATGRWNAPKGSTYADWACMYRDPRTGHVRHWAVSLTTPPVKGIAKLKAMGLWDRLDLADRLVLAEWSEKMREKMPAYHDEWGAVVAKVRAAALAHPTCPDDLYKVAGFNHDPGVYESDFDLAYAMVKAEEFGILTLPDPA